MQPWESPLSARPKERGHADLSVATSIMPGKERVTSAKNQRANRCFDQTGLRGFAPRRLCRHDIGQCCRMNDENLLELRGDEVKPLGVVLAGLPHLGAAAGVLDAAKCHGMLYLEQSCERSLCCAYTSIRLGLAAKILDQEFPYIGYPGKQNSPHRWIPMQAL